MKEIVMFVDIVSFISIYFYGFFANDSHFFPFFHLLFCFLDLIVPYTFITLVTSIVFILLMFNKMTFFSMKKKKNVSIGNGTERTD